MENSSNDIFTPIKNTTRRSLFPILNRQKFNSSNTIYKDKNKLIKTYIEKRTRLQKQIYTIEINNITLIRHMYFLEKRCNFVNITHSNTRNFIITHYGELKNLLDNTIYAYNKNLYNTSLLKEKINEINETIYNLKERICVFKV